MHWRLTQRVSPPSRSKRCRDGEGLRAQLPHLLRRGIQVVGLDARALAVAAADAAADVDEHRGRVAGVIPEGGGRRTAPASSAAPMVAPDSLRNWRRDRVLGGGLLIPPDFASTAHAHDPSTRPRTRRRQGQPMAITAVLRSDVSRFCRSLTCVRSSAPRSSRSIAGPASLQPASRRPAGCRWLGCRWRESCWHDTRCTRPPPPGSCGCSPRLPRRPHPPPAVVICFAMWQLAQSTPLMPWTSA